MIDLIQKKESWGAHVRRVRDVTIAGTAELQAQGQRISAGLQQSHEAELAQRQAAAQATAAALAQYSQTQQIINNMNRPDPVAAGNAVLMNQYLQRQLLPQNLYPMQPLGSR